MSYKFPLATSSWDEKELSAINRVIDSMHFTMGNEVLQFETEFSEYFGSNYAVMVNSGSSANLIMIASLFYTSNPMYKLRAGDEIIVPAVSWSTTFYPLMQYGLHLKFVDINLHTLNYDLASLSRAISDKTRAVMAVNLLGNPNDFIAIQDMIAGRNIILLEDNCESMGATLGEKYCGTFGLMGTFSSFFSHHISTMEGGIIVTDDEELYHVMLSLRAHGWTRNLPKINKLTGVKSDDPFEESFKFILPGYNVRPLELSGAIGIEQLKKLPDLLEGRRKNAELFLNVMSDHPNFIIQEQIGCSSWFGFSLVVRPGVEYSREQVVARLNSIGFECRPIVSGNFVKNSVMKYFDYSIFGDLINSNYIDKNGVFIGNHHYCISDAIDSLLRF